MKISESHLKKYCPFWFESLGYQILNGPDIAPGEPQAERDSYSEVVLKERLREAIYRLNPGARRRLWKTPSARCFILTRLI